MLTFQKYIAKFKFMKMSKHISISSGNSIQVMQFKRTSSNDVQNLCRVVLMERWYGNSAIMILIYCLIFTKRIMNNTFRSIMENLSKLWVCWDASTDKFKLNVNTSATTSVTKWSFWFGGISSGTRQIINANSVESTKNWDETGTTLFPQNI